MQNINQIVIRINFDAYRSKNISYSLPHFDLNEIK
jgi:hypothetical protein